MSRAGSIWARLWWSSVSAAREIEADPADRGLRILAEMLAEAAAVQTGERPNLRVMTSAGEDDDSQAD